MSTQALPYAHLGDGLATDYFQVREQFTDEQWDHFIATQADIRLDGARVRRSPGFPVPAASRTPPAC
jgi:hypothetical protein